MDAIIAPSDMMDGRVRAIRNSLEKAKMRIHTSYPTVQQNLHQISIHHLEMLW